MIRFVEQRDNKYRVRFVNLGDWEDDGEHNKLVNITKTDIENKLVATSGEREEGRGNIWVGD